MDKSKTEAVSFVGNGGLSLSHKKLLKIQLIIHMYWLEFGIVGVGLSLFLSWKQKNILWLSEVSNVNRSFLAQLNQYWNSDDASELNYLYNGVGGGYVWYPAVYVAIRIRR